MFAESKPMAVGTRPRLVIYRTYNRDGGYALVLSGYIEIDAAHLCLVGRVGVVGEPRRSWVGHLKPTTASAIHRGSGRDAKSGRISKDLAQAPVAA